MKNKKCMITIVLIILLILIDQIMKLYVSTSVNDNLVIINNILKIEKISNEGIAFGFNKENIQNIFLSILVIILIIKFLIRHEKNMNILARICLSMIISGGISNLIDRIFRGAVFDFIKLGINFPVFNFADILIFIGWIIYVIYLMIFAFRTI